MKTRELLQVLSLFSVLLAVSSSDNAISGYNLLFIDCGSSNETSGSKWRTDREFIYNGENALLTPNQNFNIMNTLRFFPDGQKNCYKLPLSSADRKFLFRAGFFYGNYDGLSKPPSFKLEIDGNLWANVTTAMSLQEPVYHELIYRTKEEQTTVCLIRNSADEVPFISSLEANSLKDDNMYRLMENNTALYLHSRINYGANRSFEQLDIYDECCNRIWKPKEMTEYLNITKDFVPRGFASEENYPPWDALTTAIQAKNVSDSIYLSVNLSLQAAVEAYFVLYFIDPIYHFPANETCKVEIYIDSQKVAALDVPEWDNYEDESSVVSLYPVRVSGSANVTISPGNGSTLAPLLNAMEVFYVIDANYASKGGHLLGISLAMCVTLLQLLGILVTSSAVN